MVKRILLFLVAIFLIPPACASVVGVGEATQVYEALFAEFGISQRNNVVLEDLQTPEDYLLSAENRLLLAQFNFHTSRGKHQRSAFGSVSVELLSQRAKDRIFSEKRRCKSAWQLFHKRFPSARSLLGLSQVGFSANKQEALVFLSSSSACLGGSMDLLMFERHGTAWKFSKAVNIARA